MHRIVRFLLLAGLAATAAFSQPSPLHTTTDSGILFSIQVDQAPTADNTLVVVGDGAVPFQVRVSTTNGGDWLSVIQSSGTTPALIGFRASRGNLAPGLYTGNVELKPSTGASFNVPASLQVCVVPQHPLDPCYPGQPRPTTGGGLRAIPENIAFVTRVDLGLTAPNLLTVIGNGSENFQIRTSTTTGGNWLSAAQSSGTTPTQIPFEANRGTLAPGQYSGSIELIPATGSPVVVNTILFVCVVPRFPLDPCYPGQDVPPTNGMVVAPTNPVFQVIRGGSPGQTTLNVIDSAGPYDVTVQTSTQDGGNWLTVDQASFRIPSQLQVTAAGQNMPAGNYSGQITLTATGHPPATVMVKMQVKNPAAPVSTIDPSFVPAPSPDTTFTITGDGFLQGAQAQLTITTAQSGSSIVPLPNAPTVVDSRTMRVVVPATFLAQPGTILLTVINRDALPSAPLKITVGRAVPQIRRNGIVNSSSLTGDNIAPGQLITLFGSALGPSTPISGTVSGSGALSQQAGGVRVLFDGTPGGVLYASDGQINAVAPNSIAARASTQVVVEYNGVRSEGVPVPVAAAAPGIYSVSGDGRGAALVTSSGVLVAGADQGVERGEVVTMYATGAGLLDTSAGDAMVARGTSRPMLPVKVRIGGQDVDVLYAGTAPGMLEAVLQINIRLPQSVPQGSAVPVELIAGDGHSQTGLTMFVK